MTLLRHFRKSARDENGNAIVEFALIAPVLMIMILGLVDAGRAIGANSRLGNGVTAALRYALSDPYATTAITQAAMSGSRYADGEATVNVARIYECPDGTVISASDTCAAGFKRIFVQVNMTRTQATVFSYPIIGDQITVSRTGSLQVP
jgi:Flp pilus assembly protein TadG